MTYATQDNGLQAMYIPFAQPLGGVTGVVVLTRSPETAIPDAVQFRNAHGPSFEALSGGNGVRYLSPPRNPDGQKPLLEQFLGQPMPLGDAISRLEGSLVVAIRPRMRDNAIVRIEQAAHMLE